MSSLLQNLGSIQQSSLHQASRGQLRLTEPAAKRHGTAIAQSAQHLTIWRYMNQQLVQLIASSRSSQIIRVVWLESFINCIPKRLMRCLQHSPWRFIDSNQWRNRSHGFSTCHETHRYSFQSRMPGGKPAEFVKIGQGQWHLGDWINSA